MGDGRGRLGTIGDAGGVAEVEDVFVRHQPADGAGDGEASDPGIQYDDGRGCGGHQAPMIGTTLRREAYRTCRANSLTFEIAKQRLDKHQTRRPPMSEVLAGKRVLIVDDDQDILQSVQAAFEPTGAVIDLANNGNKAVELAEKNLPDLVILDIMLPGRSGFLVLEKIKAKKPKNAKPFVVMITGNPGKRHQMYAESLGV